MSKKTKKQVRRSSPSAAQSVQSTPSAVNGAAPVSPVRIEKEFNPDYTPVIKDLKRIGSLAGLFIAILVILTFFLR